MIKTKVAVLEGWLLSSQSKQLKKYLKSSDWLQKSLQYARHVFTDLKSVKKLWPPYFKIWPLYFECSGASTANTSIPAVGLMFSRKKFESKYALKCVSF